MSVGAHQWDLFAVSYQEIEQSIFFFFLLRKRMKTRKNRQTVVWRSDFRPARERFRKNSIRSLHFAHVIT